MGGILGGILGGVGSAIFSAAQGKQQRDFVKKQRRTAYQDTMFDMRAAGLNPILAYKTGPTTGGQASLVSSPDFAGGAAQGSQASSASGIRRAQGGAANAAAEASRAQAALTRTSAEGVRLENIIKKVQADFSQSAAGRLAIHGRMMPASPFGVGAAATAEMVMESLKGPPRTKEWLRISPTKKTQQELDRTREERNRK